MIDERLMRETAHLREERRSPGALARDKWLRVCSAGAVWASMTPLQRLQMENAFFEGWEARQAWEAKTFADFAPRCPYPNGLCNCPHFRGPHVE